MARYHIYLCGPAVLVGVLFVGLLSSCDGSLGRGQEYWDWQKARSQSTVKLLRTFIEEYPEGANTDEARAILARVQAAEDAVWDETMQLDDRLGYRRYLTIYEEGKYTKEAQERLSSLDPEIWQRTKEIDTVHAYREYLRDFPNGEGSRLAKRKLGAAREIEIAAKEKEKALKDVANQQRGYIVITNNDVFGTIFLGILLFVGPLFRRKDGFDIPLAGRLLVGVVSAAAFVILVDYLWSRNWSGAALRVLDWFPLTIAAAFAVLLARALLWELLMQALAGKKDSPMPESEEALTKAETAEDAVTDCEAPPLGDTSGQEDLVGPESSITRSDAAAVVGMAEEGTPHEAKPPPTISEAASIPEDPTTRQDTPKKYKTFGGEDSMTVEQQKELREALKRANIHSKHLKKKK